MTTPRCSLRNDAGPTNTAAISLWQKFSLLQQSIEECIKERKEIDAKIDASQMKQSDLRELRRESLEESHEAERKLNEIEAKIAALQCYYDEKIQPAYASALLDKRSIEIRLNQWKEYKASTLQLFLDRSAKFRLDCKRLQMTSEALGLRHANNRSWMYVINSDWGDDVGDATLDDSNEWIHQIRPTDEDAERDNPLLWNIPKGDDELLELAEKYNHEFDAYEVFRKDLDILKSRKTECLQHEQALTERATLMQKQLNRILNDCNDLESQIAHRTVSSRLGQPPTASGRSTPQYHESSNEKQHAKRARTNPYNQSKTNRSNNLSSKRKKALQSVVLGSTTAGTSTVSPPLLLDSTTKTSEPSRFQRFQFVSDTGEGETHLQGDVHDAERTIDDEDRGISSSGEQRHAIVAIEDDDDEEDDLFSFIGLRK